MFKIVYDNAFGVLPPTMCSRLYCCQKPTNVADILQTLGYNISAIGYDLAIIDVAHLDEIFDEDISDNDLTIFVTNIIAKCDLYIGNNKPVYVNANNFLIINDVDIICSDMEFDLTCYETEGELVLAFIHYILDITSQDDSIESTDNMMGSIQSLFSMFTNIKDDTYNL